MDEQKNTPTTPQSAQWVAPPTVKERNAVQRSVDRLLDELAPERAPARSGRLPVAIERHRTPTGCVLQAPAAAVSVSWFPDAANDATLGELQVVVWRGVVTRRGTAPRAESAAVVRELALRPVERPANDCVWRAADGTLYDTDALAAHCLALLEEQTGTTPPPEPTR